MEMYEDQETETIEPEQETEEEEVETSDDNMFNFNPMNIPVPAFMQGI